MFTCHSCAGRRSLGNQPPEGSAAFGRLLTILLAKHPHLPPDVEAGRLVHGQCGDVEVAWAYERLKPALRTALEQVPSLYSFTGD